MATLTRRDLLRQGCTLVGSGMLAACAPQVVKETVVVEKVVKEVVKETILVEGTPQVVEKVVVATQPPLPVEEPYELRVHTRVGADLDQYFVTVLEQFKDIVPNATVKIEAVPGDALQYAAKVLVLHAGGQIGDALWSASRAGFNRRFMAVGIFAPLDPLIEAERFDIGQYYPNCIEETRYEDEIMALPHISEPGQIGLMMNLDHFEEVGIEPLGWDSTLEDLVNAAVKLTRMKDGRQHFGFSRDTNYFNWVTMARSFGGDFLNPEGTQCVLDDEKALAAFQFLYDMVYAHKAAPSPDQIENTGGAMFQGGILSMYVGWPIHASNWPSAIKDFRVGSTMLPPGPAGRGSMLNQHMMSVASASQHVAGAWEWVKWTCGRQFSRERALSGKGGPVGMPSVWNDPEILQMFPAWEEWARVMGTVGPNYTAANLRGKELEDTFNQNVMAIMVQEVGVPEGLARVREECQKVLDAPVAT